MLHSGFIKPGSIANVQIEIQIVDTHESLETSINSGFAASTDQFNRTLLIRCLSSTTRKKHKALYNTSPPRPARWFFPP
jgi:hypothetical protein